ncbi:hypothetical protein [Stenotrophomonas humi]
MSPIATTFVFLGAALLLGIATVSAIRSGHVFSAPASIEISRIQRPLLYWLVVALQIIGIAVFIGLAIA